MPQNYNYLQGDNGLFPAIADSIRSVEGTSGKILANDFPKRINDIGNVVVNNLTDTIEINKQGSLYRESSEWEPEDYTDVRNYGKAVVKPGAITLNGTLAPASSSPNYNFTVPYEITNENGVISVQPENSISITPTVTAGWVSSMNSYTAGINSCTLALDTEEGQTILPDDTTHTISSGKYTTGDIVISPVPISDTVNYLEDSSSSVADITITSPNLARVTKYKISPDTGKYLKDVILNINTENVGANNQNKTVTPSTSQQEITADQGYTGLGTVTVEAIPYEQHDDEGLVTIDWKYPSKTYQAGYYPHTHGAEVVVEDVLITPTTESRIYSPPLGKVYGTITTVPMPSVDVELTGSKDDDYRLIIPRDWLVRV